VKDGAKKSKSAEHLAMTDAVLLEAVAFAARAHRTQIRKDGQTPYVSHAYRVCLVLREIFGVADRQALAAALLHDTIEDTTTDYDDLARHFGDGVARLVVWLTKDSCLPEEEREAAYCQGLSEAPWQAKVCKLADIYDNLQDSCHLTPEQRVKTQRKARRYLEALALNLTPEAASAWNTVDAYLRQQAAEKV
jgi:guanosine-3',5'-bis(diphosphate) 3'-pyrophosphohydrolase